MLTKDEIKVLRKLVRREKKRWWEMFEDSWESAWRDGCADKVNEYHLLDVKLTEIQNEVG